jgi:hypothetical protein
MTANRNTGKACAIRHARRNGLTARRPPSILPGGRATAHCGRAGRSRSCKFPVRACPRRRARGRVTGPPTVDGGTCRVWGMHGASWHGALQSGHPLAFAIVNMTLLPLTAGMSRPRAESAFEALARAGREAKDRAAQHGLAEVCVPCDCTKTGARYFRLSPDLRRQPGCSVALYRKPS